MRISAEKLQTFASGEISATFQTSIVQDVTKFQELGEKVRQNFIVLNKTSPQTFVFVR